MLKDISLVVIAFSFGFVVVFQWKYHRMNKIMFEQTMQMLRALGDTHMQGFEALTIDLQRLEGRVRELEERLL